jgi:hypothetical protein
MASTVNAIACAKWIQNQLSAFASQSETGLQFKHVAESESSKICRTGARRDVNYLLPATRLAEVAGQR